MTSIKSLHDAGKMTLKKKKKLSTDFILIDLSITAALLHLFTPGPTSPGAAALYFSPHLLTDLSSSWYF